MGMFLCEKSTQSPSFAETGCASHGKLEDTGQLQDSFTWMEDLDCIQPLRSTLQVVNSLMTRRLHEHHAHNIRHRADYNVPAPHTKLYEQKPYNARAKLLDMKTLHAKTLNKELKSWLARRPFHASLHSCPARA